MVGMSGAAPCGVSARTIRTTSNMQMDTGVTMAMISEPRTSKIVGWSGFDAPSPPLLFVLVPWLPPAELLSTLNAPFSLSSSTVVIDKNANDSDSVMSPRASVKEELWLEVCDDLCPLPLLEDVAGLDSLVGDLPPR